MKHVKVSDQACWSLMKHIKVSNKACWSPMGLPSGMSVLDEEC